MLNFVTSEEILELLCNKLSTITSNQLLRETICSDHGAQGIYCCFSSCTEHAQHLQPFGLCIDDYQERSTLERVAVVHMHSLPRTVCPYPRVVSSTWCFTVRCMTKSHSSSPTVQCQCPVLATKQVSALRLSSAQFQDGLSVALLTPILDILLGSLLVFFQQTSFLHCELVSFKVITFQVIWNLFLPRPSV